MRTIEEIKSLIEEKRKELDALVLTEELESYYKKSTELDKLIEEYLDLVEELEEEFEEDDDVEFVEE